MTGECVFDRIWRSLAGSPDHAASLDVAKRKLAIRARKTGEIMVSGFGDLSVRTDLDGRVHSFEVNPAFVQDRPFWSHGKFSLRIGHGSQDDEIRAGLAKIRSREGACVIRLSVATLANPRKLRKTLALFAEQGFEPARIILALDEIELSQHPENWAILARMKARSFQLALIGNHVVRMGLSESLRSILDEIVLPIRAFAHATPERQQLLARLEVAQTVGMRCVAADVHAGTEVVAAAKLGFQLIAGPAATRYVAHREPLLQSAA